MSFRVCILFVTLLCVTMIDGSLGDCLDGSCEASEKSDPLEGTLRGAMLDKMRKTIRSSNAGLYAVLATAQLAEALGIRDTKHALYDAVAEKTGYPRPDTLHSLNYVEWLQSSPMQWTKEDNALLAELEEEAARHTKEGTHAPVFWESLRVTLRRVKEQSDPTTSRSRLSTLG